MTAILIPADDYLKDNMKNFYRQQTYDKLYKINDKHTRSYNSEASNNTEKKRKGTEIETTHLKEYRDAVQNKKLIKHKAH